MVLTRQSRWREQWQRLRENNPITNGRALLIESDVVYVIAKCKHYTKFHFPIHTHI